MCCSASYVLILTCECRCGWSVQVVIAPPYDLKSCSQLVSNPNLFGRMQKVVRSLNPPVQPCSQLVTPIIVFLGEQYPRMHLVSGQHLTNCTSQKIYQANKTGRNHPKLCQEMSGANDVLSYPGVVKPPSFLIRIRVLMLLVICNRWLPLTLRIHLFAAFGGEAEARILVTHDIARNDHGLNRGPFKSMIAANAGNPMQARWQCTA